MNSRVWMCGCGLIVFFLVCVCSVSEAQELPVPSGGSHVHHGASPPGQAEHVGQQRACPGKKRQTIARPERNRFEETRHTGGGARHRRSRRTHSSRQNRSTPHLSDVSKGLGKTGNTRHAGETMQVAVKTERIDDIPVLLAAMGKMRLQAIIDRHIPIQRHQRALSWGWTTVIWLAYVLSEGDHRKVAVQAYVRNMQQTLCDITGQQIHEYDFADDRLTVLLSYLEKTAWWEAIEQDLSRHSIDAYALPTDTARVDATTVSGYHVPVEGGLFQYGHSKDDPSRPQIKVMTGGLDPLGMPLASDVVSGEQADDGLYAPIITRISAILEHEGVLYVGDCKLSAHANRLHIKGKTIRGHYLCPLPRTGKTPEEMQAWITQGNRLDARDELFTYIVTNDKGEDVLKAKGYEVTREQSGEVEAEEIRWEERVLIVNSPAHQHRQVKGLETRLTHAEEKLYNLTPARGPGKRQLTDEADLREKADAIVKHHRVQGLLTYEFVREVQRKTSYVGRGRGSKTRTKKVT